ncbi:MAG TPA: glycosyltransferase [Blastocatellia bacterium]|nr:glycosyltransferase [Blastocatellia bacterium]
MVPESKVVMIAGAYGYGNTGDDAILNSVTGDLRRAIPNLRIIALSHNPAETGANCDVEAIHWQDINQIVQSARLCDLMLVGGGALFYDYWGADPDTLLTESHAEISYFTGLSLLSRLLEKPLMFYAVGVGPLLTEEGRLLTRVAFEQASCATVRDPQSKSLLEQIGLPPDPVLVTADLAFQIQSGDSNIGRKILEAEAGMPIQPPLIGAALRQWNVGVDPDSWERAVAEAFDSFLRRRGGTLVFIPFHRAVAGGLADDILLATRIRQRMERKSQAIVLQKERAPEEIASLVAQCDLLLGMRFHSLVFALKAGVPIVALTYDPKVSNLLANLSLTRLGIAPAEAASDRLASMLEDGFSSRAYFKTGIEAKVRELAALSGKNLERAVELLAIPPPLAPLSSSAISVLNRPAVRQTISRLGFHDTVNNLIGSAISHSSVTLQSTGQSEEMIATSPHATNRAATRPADFGHFIRQARENSPAPKKRTSAETISATRRPSVAYLTYMLLDWQTQKPRFGGGERYALTLGGLLRDSGFDVTFYQGATSRFTGEYYGFPVISIPFAQSYSEFQYGLSDEFFRLTEGYDHIIYNLAEFSTGEMREDAVLICHGVWFDHNNYPPPTAYRTREWFSHLYRAFGRPRKVVSVDTNSINVIRALWPELASRMIYVPNWVDTQMFRPPPVRDNDRLTVLIPRRSQINRGSQLIGPILDRVHEDCDFIWVGEGEIEETEHIKRVAERDSRLRFDCVPFEQMPDFYRQADICVIPTIGSEGTSLSCLEALASGCAVIATNVGGLPNMIQHEVCGLLVDPEPEEIATAINRLIADPRERAKYQRAGVAVANHFDISRWRKRWNNLLHELQWLA